MRKDTPWSPRRRAHQARPDPSLPPDPAMASGATVEGPPNGGGEGEGSRHDGMGEDELRKTMAEIFVDFGLGSLAEI